MAAELRPRLVGSRVQKIVQPAPTAIAIELYRHHERTWLFLSADPQRPRVYTLSHKPGRGVETPSPLLLLLRKHVEGLRLGAIVQPSGERILRFGFLGYPSAADHEADDAPSEPRVLFWLIIEAISQYSNLILIDAANVVREAVRRVSAEQNRFRVTLPHHPYVPPPLQAKRDLAAADARACAAALRAAGAGAAVGPALVAGFAGLGPLAGREATYRAFGDAKATVPADPTEIDASAARLAATLGELVQPAWDGTFQASVALADSRAGQSRADGGEGGAGALPVVAFAPYPLTHLGRWEPRPSLSRAAEEFYAQVQEVGALDLARRAVHAALAAERSLVERKRESLQRALEGTAQAEAWRQQGELLLAYSSAIPRGAATFRADGVDLELDPRGTAVENAQALFRRYRKAKAALREVPALLQEVELRRRYLDEIAALVDLADTVDQLRQLRLEIRPPRADATRPTRRKRVRRPVEGILCRRTADGVELLVGRSAQQNQVVTFELGRPDDVWLHARGCPGAHVILRTGGAEPSPGALAEAAAVTAYYSANRGSARVAVDWTRRKHVRHLGKGTPGLVSYTGEQTLVVRPAEPGPTDEA